MEILISLVTGIVLMEVYVWLDPLSIWLVRRVAKTLPEETRAEFVEQFTADLATLPNSISKVYFAFRDCTLAANSIRQAVVREAALTLADEYKSTYNEMGLLHQSLGELRAATFSKLGKDVQFVSTIDQCLETLRRKQRRDDLEAQTAVQHFEALSLPVSNKIRTLETAFEQKHEKLSALTDALHKTMTNALEASEKIRWRMLDENPLEDTDLELLLSAFHNMLKEIGPIQAAYRIELTSYASLISNFPANFATEAHAIVEALQAAAQLVIHPK
jgi:hypothetical protein